MSKTVLLVEDNPTDEKLTHVRKPVDFGQFLQAMRTLELFWLLINESLPGRPR